LTELQAASGGDGLRPAPPLPFLPPAGPGYRNGLLVLLGVGLFLRVLVALDLAAHDPLFDLPDGDARMYLD